MIHAVHRTRDRCTGSPSTSAPLLSCIPGHPSGVSCICIGMAASMGAFLLSSGSKGKRFCLPNSEVMIHQPLGGAQGQATEIKIAAERILKLKSKLNKILANNTGKDVDVIEHDTERDYFLDSDEALNYGLVDKIL